MGLVLNNRIEQELTKEIFYKFLETTHILNITKINKVSDFYQFCCKIYVSSNLQQYNVDVDIDCNLKIAKRVKNIICEIRNLIIEQNIIIFENINKIDSFNKNYDKYKNSEKIVQLNHLLNIEKLKIDNSHFDTILNISENIVNLYDELSVLKNDEIKFQKGIEDIKKLKIQFINISLFLRSTDHFDKNLIKSDINVYPLATCKFI